MHTIKNGWNSYDIIGTIHTQLQKYCQINTVWIWSNYGEHLLAMTACEKRYREMWLLGRCDGQHVGLCVHGEDAQRLAQLQLSMLQTIDNNNTKTTTTKRSDNNKLPLHWEPVQWVLYRERIMFSIFP